ncbi:MAG TPA: SRPBCC domain-containing protein [Polyangiaceae bacterium]|nr:SRPBCC domain-containing protein [Polyangiaceae bacterium]
MATTELRTEVEINAPAAHVYRILTDFERYHEWNPFIPSIAGKLQVGQQLALEVSLPEGKSYLLKPRITQLTEDAELRWRGSYLFPFLLQAEHFFLVAERGERQTRFVQGENFSGLLLRFAGSMLTLTARGLVYMNQALKKRAEGQLTQFDKP